MKNRKFKPGLFKIGIIMSLLASTNIVNYNVTNNRNQYKAYQKGYEKGFEDGKQESKEENIAENNEIPVNDEIEIKKDSTVEYILNMYNGLGNNLTREDLGLVESSSLYLYKDSEIDKYVLDSVNYKEPDSYKTIPEGDKSDVFIYVDKTNKSKPIAGITKIKDKYVNVKIKSYSNIGTDGGTIKMDENKYINFIGTDEDMEKYYFGTIEYLDERISKVRGR